MFLVSVFGNLAKFVICHHTLIEIGDVDMTLRQLDCIVS